MIFIFKKYLNGIIKEGKKVYPSWLIRDKFVQGLWYGTLCRVPQKARIIEPRNGLKDQ